MIIPVKNTFFNLVYEITKLYQYIYKLLCYYRKIKELKEPIISNIMHKKLYYSIPQEDIQTRIIIYDFVKKSINKNKCCNPNCDNIINGVYFFAYDGKYCSVVCQDIMIKILDKYWQNMI
jgi:hypothetical protein